MLEGWIIIQLQNKSDEGDELVHVLVDIIASVVHI
jgi:hypothetical protein